MAPLSTESTGIRRRDVALVVVLGLTLFLPGLGARSLWNPDEPRYAEVAREMLLTGEWFVPHVNGRVYTQKPPLQFWAMAASSFVFGGMDERAARLPAILSVTGTMVLLLLMGTRLFLATSRVARRLGVRLVVQDRLAGTDRPDRHAAHGARDTRGVVLGPGIHRGSARTLSILFRGRGVRDPRERTGRTFFHPFSPSSCFW